MNKGLALLIFDRTGTTADPDEDGPTMIVSLKTELYVHPIKRDLTVNPALRGADDLLESLIKFLHQLDVGPGVQHCINELKVTGFREVPGHGFHCVPDRPPKTNFILTKYCYVNKTKSSREEDGQE